MLKYLHSFLPRSVVRNTRIWSALRHERRKRIHAEESTARLEQAIKEFKKSTTTGEEPKDFSRVIAANMISRNKLEIVKMNIKSRYNIALLTTIIGAGAALLYRLILDDQADKIKKSKYQLAAEKKAHEIVKKEFEDSKKVMQSELQLLEELQDSYSHLTKKFEALENERNELKKLNDSCNEEIMVWKSNVFKASDEQYTPKADKRTTIEIEVSKNNRL